MLFAIRGLLQAKGLTEYQILTHLKNCGGLKRYQNAFATFCGLATIRGVSIKSSLDQVAGVLLEIGSYST